MHQPPQRLGIIVKPGEPRAVELAARIAEWAAARDIDLAISDRIPDSLPGTPRAPDGEIAEHCDLLVV